MCLMDNIKYIKIFITNIYKLYFSKAYFYVNNQLNIPKNKNSQLKNGIIYIRRLNIVI